MSLRNGKREVEPMGNNKYPDKFAPDRRPRDTSLDDPMITLIDALASVGRGGSSSDFILEQEAQGQREMVNSDVLPIKISGSGTIRDFEALGFVFGDGKIDGIFRPATLPMGWKREASDHDMWSYIVDETGKRRVAIFYKAAFYDRDAFMSLEGS